MKKKIAADQTRSRTLEPPVGEHMAVGGRKLFVHSQGVGDPAVVFLAGAGLSGLDYFNVQTKVAKFTRAIVYDRAGTGWSDPADTPLTSTAVVNELKALLAKLGIVKPVILVGHSLGGLYARHYAMRFPDDIAGLVLLDPGHEDYDSYMPKELVSTSGSRTMTRVLDTIIQGALKTKPTRALLGSLPAIKRYQHLYEKLFKEEMAAWPATIRDALVDRHSTLEWLSVGIRETRGIETRYLEVSKAGQTPDVPLIALCSVARDGFQQAVSSGQSEALIKGEIEGRLRLYKDLAASVPRGEMRSVESGHVTISLRHPDEVTKAIRDVIRRTR